MELALYHPSGTQTLEVAPRLCKYSWAIAVWCSAHSNFRMAVVLSHIPVQYVTRAFSVGVKTARACSCPRGALTVAVVYQLLPVLMCLDTVRTCPLTPVCQ